MYLLLSLDEAGEVRVFGVGRHEAVDYAAADGDALHKLHHKLHYKLQIALVTLRNSA